MKKIYNTEFKFNKIFLATQLGIALLVGMSSSAYTQGLGGEDLPEPPNIDFSAIDDMENHDMYININNGKNVSITGGHSGNQYGGQGSLIVQVDDGFSGAPALGAPSNGAGSFGTVDTSVILTATANNMFLETDQHMLTIAENASVTGSIYGGQTVVTVDTGMAMAGNIESTFSIASAKAGASTRAYADDAILNANNNTLVVSEGSAVTGGLYGGSAALMMQAQNAQGGSINAFAGLESNEAYVGLFARATTLSANDNIITAVKDAAITGDVAGGQAIFIAKAGDAKGGEASGGAISSNIMDVSYTKVLANNNVVDFNGTLQSGNLYGGYTEFNITQGTAKNYDGSAGQVDRYLDDTVAQATNNTLTIGDNAKINNVSTSLYGGYLTYNTTSGIKPENYDVFTNNTLNFSAQPVTVNTVANFENYNFTLDPILANTGTALITANTIIFGANADNVSTGAETASKLQVVGIHAGDVLSAGNEFVLMRADNMSGKAEGLTTKGIAQQGVSLLYDVEAKVDSTNNMVTATILGCKTGSGDTCPNGAASVNPQLKALSEGYLSGLMLVTRGADMIADSTLGAIRTQAQNNGFTPFLITSAGYNRYSSGSHVTSKDLLVVGGVGLQHNGLTLGAFIEGGRGNYDSYNSFYTMADVHGKGHSRYLGAGIVGRYELDNRFYVEGSLRAGKVRTKFGTQDIQNIATKEFANYRVSSTYVSAHIGTGYKLTLSDTNSLDLSAKYLWSSVGSKNIKVAGDNIHFDRMNSNRMRINATFNHQQSESLTFMAGLGYEYEFSGKANATTYDSYRIDAPSVKGSTGILSLGVRVTPTASKNLTLDFKAEGYAGKRKGGSVGFQVKYHF